MKRELLSRVNDLRSRRSGAVLVTDLADGTQQLFADGDPLEGELGQAVGKAMQTGRSGVVAVGGHEVFLNAYLPPVRIVVIGAVHISQALAPMARIAGFDLEIIDPRTAFATPERFPDAQLFAEWPEEVLARRPLDRYCGVAAITHDPKIDDAALLAAIRAHCFYVGALGSRKTHGKRAERLAAAGLDAAQIARIAAPIGLDIGASTPAEIAVAILAEVIEAFRRRGLSAGQAAEEERMLDA